MKKIRDRRSFFCNLTLLSLSITNSSYARNYKLEITQFSSLMTATFDKLYAILRRDLLTTIRHRSGFVLSLVGTFTELAAFYFLSRAIGSGFRPDGVAFFPFLLVGTGVYTFFVMSVQAFVSAVQEAQQTGTLEVLMTSSTGPVELLILSSISAFAGTLGNLLIYLSAGVAVFRAAIHPNFFSCVAVMICSLVVALALGIALVPWNFSRAPCLSHMPSMACAKPCSMDGRSARWPLPWPSSPLLAWSCSLLQFFVCRSLSAAPGKMEPFHFIEHADSLLRITPS
jgi:ABC-type multidrug transport system permease subunit